MICGRRVVVEDAEIGSGFEPEIVWLARMDSGRVKELLAVARQREERVIDVRRTGAALDVGPVVVLHQNHKDVAVGIEPGRVRNGGDRSKTKTNKERPKLHIIALKRARCSQTGPLSPRKSLSIS